MTTQELRIAKLSKILNSSMVDKNAKNEAISQAYERAYEELQKKINNEKIVNFENEERMRFQAQIEKQEDIIKENIRKHHFAVLKKQIEDRKKNKEINEVEKLMERPKAMPRTPPELPNFGHRENLKDQIKEKRKNVKESQKKELDMDRFMLKLAKVSLEDDIKKKRQEKDTVFDELKKNWDGAVVLNKLKKQADRLKLFGNISLKKNFKNYPIIEKNKELQILTPKIKKNRNKSLASKTEKKSKIFDTPTKSKEPKDRSLNHSCENPKSPQSITKEEAAQRLEMIKEREEKIKNSKKEIMDYLSKRSRSKN